MRSLFLDEDMREFCRDWEGLTAWAVRWLRDFASHQPDPGMDALIEELRSHSAHFRALWATYDVRRHGRGLLLINHPWSGRSMCTSNSWPCAAASTSWWSTGPTLARRRKLGCTS